MSIRNTEKRAIRSDPHAATQAANSSEVGSANAKAATG
jgi:hypothetical protein